MFEITYNDDYTLQNFIDAGKAYRDAIYDFTFENRFIIYHFFVKDEARYVALDVDTGCGSEVTRRKKDNLFTDVSYRNMIPKILESIKYTGDWRYLNTVASDPLAVIKSIFQTILPEYGFTVRKEQINLSLNMYKSMTEKQIGICEAEVGTGKTMAYLIAGFVARTVYAREYGFHLPVTVTTSSIELQKMIVEKEIPQLSRMLQDYGLIKHPLTSVLRKGKEHYFCLARYNDYMDKIGRSPDKYEDLINTLRKYKMDVQALDLDKWNIPNAIKSRVCVKGSCSACKHKAVCRYMAFVERANEKGSVDFQVTNHNLYLTSIKAEVDQPGRRILQNSPYVVIDEAHKLLEAAQSTFGVQIEEDAVKRYLNSVKYLCCSKSSEDEYTGLMAAAAQFNRTLFASLRKNLPSDSFDDDGLKCITIEDADVTTIIKLAQTIQQIEALRKQKRCAYEIDGKQLANNLRTFSRQNNIDIWLESGENGLITLCCCPDNMANVLAENVWNRDVAHLLTSATMSDGTDFSFFKRENGIDRLDRRLVFESSSPSPFNYRDHARLYIPDDMPMPENDDPRYIDAITNRIKDLIRATHGHTAILFTSYKVLQAVYEKAAPDLPDYDVFRMTRNNRSVISEFRKSRNGILFASGSMWEGVDCVGDCLSSVIIVRLPFPLRNAVLEQKKDATGSLWEFIQNYALPEMLIKLRQGAGRLIRSESDTGVVSILDARAAGGKFSFSVLNTLEKYPVVDDVVDVASFIRSVKSPEYFTE